MAFDVDAISLVSLKRALPGWQIETVNGATASSLARTWNPAAADLLVVGIRGNGMESLGLCRFLAFCTSYTEDFQPGPVEPMEGGDSCRTPRASDAPLLVLVLPDQGTLVEEALAAGAHGCIVRPIHFKEVLSMVPHARAGNQPGRHTLNLEGAQQENLWRDDGGEA
jgi:DNA-binding NarL/FixJ family response regulator